MSFFAPFDRWIQGQAFILADPAESVSVCRLFQPEAHAMGMDELVLGRIFGHPYPIVFPGCME